MATKILEWAHDWAAPTHKLMNALFTREMNINYWIKNVFIFLRQINWLIRVDHNKYLPQE
jgi:hypothetical protein